MRNQPKTLETLVAEIVAQSEALQPRPRAFTAQLVDQQASSLELQALAESYDRQRELIFDLLSMAQHDTHSSRLRDLTSLLSDLADTSQHLIYKLREAADVFNKP